MNTYKTIINYQLNIEAENEEELNKIISKLTLPNQVKQKVVKTSKINTNCLSCGVDVSLRTKGTYFCSNRCRSAFNNEKYKQNINGELADNTLSLDEINSITNKVNLKIKAKDIYNNIYDYLKQHPLTNREQLIDHLHKEH
tara:strand:- start:322 stop:744 length:423 start_codon:yes stop_codon:yes gene_type:complete